MFVPLVPRPCPPTEGADLSAPASRTHFLIPDTQSKPGTPSDHLGWIGKYILERRPDVVIHIGDAWDMPSLSSYDKGKKAMENRRYDEDVEKGNADFDLLSAPTRIHNARRRTRHPYLPEWEFTFGNHEWRIMRAIEDNAQLDGAIGLDDLDTGPFRRHDFLDIAWIDGIAYSHYFANPMTGRPLGGLVSTRLKTIGHSFTMGHQQTLDHAARFIQGPNGVQMQRGLVAGAAYLHAEDYLGHQGNAHWRGVVVCHEVDGGGGYSLMEVPLDFLCRKYEGVSLATFMRETYPGLNPSLEINDPEETP